MWTLFHHPGFAPITGLTCEPSQLSPLAIPLSVGIKHILHPHCSRCPTGYGTDSGTAEPSRKTWKIPAAPFTKAQLLLICALSLPSCLFLSCLWLWWARTLPRKIISFRVDFTLSIIEHLLLQKRPPYWTFLCNHVIPHYTLVTLEAAWPCWGTPV